ncbi:MAG: amino acid permease [Victivallaceae bacterium]|nr:amino acid permease [Victivallaceae bacterium]
MSEGNSKKLQKNLSLLGMFSICAGAMISSGIFILPGIAFEAVGPAVFLAYLLAGIMAFIGTLAVVELSTAMPKAGGDYYFIERSLGPLAGTVSGFLSWMALSLKSSFAIFGLAEATHLIFGVNFTMVAMLGAVGFTVLNIIGVKGAIKMEIIMVVGLLAILALYTGFGLPKIVISNFDPFIAEGKSSISILATAAIVFVSFGGLLNASSVAEEAKNPRRTIPFAMLGAVVVVSLLYVMVLIVTVGLLPGKELAGSLTPLAEAAKQHFGQIGFWLITIGALLAFITTANAGIMSASRYPMALSRDKLAPQLLSKVNKKFDVPVMSIITTGVVIMLSLLLNLDMLVKAASTVILLSYILTNLAVIILNESGIQNYRPSFRSPLYPWLQFISIVVFASMIVAMGFESIEISLGIIMLALFCYLFFGRKVSREFALLHLISRITNRKLQTHELEGELREILHHRDEIVKDDFDQLVEEAIVLIASEAMTTDSLFRECADTLAPLLNLNSENVFKLLHEREAESSTVITPEVAIPHLIIEGKECFKLMLVKNSEGIKFSDEYDTVKAVFVLAGSRDQRNRHLRSLSAIAQIIQNPKFEIRWGNATTDRQLRDMLLLAKRKRL